MAQIDTADEAQQQPPRVYAEDFPEAVVDGVAQFFGKPRLRGWIHVYAAVVAFIAGAGWLYRRADRRTALRLYLFSLAYLALLFGAMVADVKL